ncbi:hypothetical protein DRO26_04705 [Candidatus Bathyarchaeota archaeon]|nr:MAG: hypothetical protein DRO26_04705 [Candidatus Bathyarchaeota archaeon]
MSTNKGSKPFYLKPPWQILFDLVRLYKMNPWDINIAYLLSTFLTEMKKEGFIDFAASGTALLSSSVVLRLQSERILKMEEPPKLPQLPPSEQIPPPLQLPFRYEFTSTTIENLLTALEEVLKNESIQRPVKLTPIELPSPDFFKEHDRFFAEIESRIDEFYNVLKNMGTEEAIPFSRLVQNKSKQEIVRIFLLLLFLASKGLVDLFQEEEFGEIYITITGKVEEYERKPTTT